MTRVAIIEENQRPTLVLGEWSEVLGEWAETLQASHSKTLALSSKDEFSRETNSLKAEIPTSCADTIVLESPQGSKDFIFDPDENYSVTSEVSKMVTAMALANQYSYSIQYNQALQSSTYSAFLAPVVREFVLGNWENQALSTECDADKSVSAGIGILITGTIGAGMGAWTYFSEAGKNATDAIVKEGVQAAGGAVENAAASSVSAAARTVTSEAEHAASSAGVAASSSRSTSSVARAPTIASPPGTPVPPVTPPAAPATSPTRANLEKGASAGSKALKMGQIVSKMMGGMQAAMMIGEGGIKLGADQKFDYKKAGKQRLIGMFDAHEKETSAYQGAATSSSQRMNEAASQSQKNHGDVLDIMKRTAESISGAVAAAQRS